MKKLLNTISNFAVAVTLCTVTFVAEKSFASNPYQVFKKDRIDIYLATNFFKTQANFTADGSQQALPSNNYFQNIEVMPELRWELFEDLGLIGGFNFASSESSDPQTTRKNSTVNRIDIGVDYLFWNSDIHESFFRFIYSHPLETTDLNADSVSNSDGVSEIKPEMVIRFNFDGLYPYAQAGLNYRSAGLSMLATYAAGIEARFSEIGLGAAVIGRTSIKDDDQTSSSNLRDIFNSRVNAGSKKYFAINPNSTDIEVNLNFAASDSLIFKLFGGYTVLGSNSAVGYNVGLGVNFTFAGSARSHRSYKNKNTSSGNLDAISHESTSTNFKENTDDGVNQEYFKPVSPVQKNYINQVEGAPQNLKNVTTPEPQHDDIQLKKKLVNMDYTIKLKKKKKKNGN